MTTPSQERYRTCSTASIGSSSRFWTASLTTGFFRNKMQWQGKLGKIARLGWTTQTPSLPVTTAKSSAMAHRTKTDRSRRIWLTHWPSVVAFWTSLSYWGSLSENMSKLTRRSGNASMRWTRKRGRILRRSCQSSQKRSHKLLNIIRAIKVCLA